MDVTGSTSDEVTIRLTGNEALILSDALASAERSGALLAIHHDDPATRRVIDDLIASFESVVDEASTTDYKDRVEQARRAIVDDS